MGDMAGRLWWHGKLKEPFKGVSEGGVGSGDAPASPGVSLPDRFRRGHLACTLQNRQTSLKTDQT